MASITVEVQSARLTAKFGSSYGVAYGGKWTLSMRVNLPFPEELELGTGEKTSVIDMRLSIHDARDEIVEWATERTKRVEDIGGGDSPVIGLMTYHPEWSSRDGLDGGPASILFEVYASPELMASLVRFAEGGRHLKTVRLDVRGLEYGWTPDGSQKRWLGNKEGSMLPVTAIDYDLPIAEDPPERLPGEPSTPVGLDLAPTLRELLKTAKVALWLLAAIAVVVIFKR